MTEWMDIVIVISVVIIILYFWLTRTFDFWKSRGIVGPSPIPYFGNTFNVSIKKISLAEYLKMIYDKNQNEKMVGIYLGHEPVLIIRDPELIADVLIKDFSTFPSHGVTLFNNINGPLSDNIFNLELTRWRPLRTKLSPIFTSGKLKKMFYLFLECGERLKNKLEKLSINDEPIIECYEFLTKYAIDVIGNCLIGVQFNSLNKSNSDFYKICKDVLIEDWKTSFKIHIKKLTPSLFRLIEPFVNDSKIANLFINILRDTIDHRKKNNIVKHDLIDLMMELRNNSDKVDNIELTDIFFAAQLLGFLIAGYETSTNVISHALYELAKNQTIQDKVREDINNELEKSDGKLTYESVKSMKYLHMVYQESLRLYPPPLSIARKSVQEYTFDGTKLTIPAGTIIMIPVFGIHRDPQIYPRPEVFDPERFTDEAIKFRHTMNSLEFGEGPRRCIGSGFAAHGSKVGLINILQNYKVEVCDKTQIPFIIDPNRFTLSSNHGIHLKISKVH